MSLMVEDLENQIGASGLPPNPRPGNCTFAFLFLGLGSRAWSGCWSSSCRLCSGLVRTSGPLGRACNLFAGAGRQRIPTPDLLSYPSGHTSIPTPSRPGAFWLDPASRWSPLAWYLQICSCSFFVLALALGPASIPAPGPGRASFLASTPDPALGCAASPVSAPFLRPPPPPLQCLHPCPCPCSCPCPKGTTLSRCPCLCLLRGSSHRRCSTKWTSLAQAVWEGWPPGAAALNQGLVHWKPSLPPDPAAGVLSRKHWLGQCRSGDLEGPVEGPEATVLRSSRVTCRAWLLSQLE